MIAYRFGEGFPVLDLQASCCFQTPASISFHLGTRGDTLHLSDGDWPVGSNGVFTVIGFVDVHFPGDGSASNLKALLRIGLPSRYHQYEQMKKLVAQIFEALNIPSDETYEAHFISGDKQTMIANDPYSL